MPVDAPECALFVGALPPVATTGARIGLWKCRMSNWTAAVSLLGPQMRCMSSLTAGESLLQHIRGEFLESPGLRLTLSQFQRLWNLDVDECRTVVQRLVHSRFLREAADGTLVRDES